MKREYEILRLLIQRGTFVSIRELAEHFGISLRSVRNDIRNVEGALKEYGMVGVELQRDRYKGIAIKADKKQQGEFLRLLSQWDETDYYSREKRIRIILEELIIRPTTVNRLMDITYSSRTTVQRDLGFCEKWMRKWGAVLLRRPHYGLKMEASETAYRNTVLNYIWSYTEYCNAYQSGSEEFFGVLTSHEIAGQYFREINTVFLRNFIKKYESNMLMKFIDESKAYIFLYICIAVRRIKDGNVIAEKELAKDYVIEGPSIQWIRQNRNLFQEGTGVEMTAEEEILLAARLEGGKLHRLEMVDDHEAMEMAGKFIKSAQAALTMPLLTEDYLKRNLALHIKTAIHRLRCNVKIENPIKDEIYESYPYAVNAAKAGAGALSEQFGSTFNEDEISYFAMYIAASVERNKPNPFLPGIVKAVLVCPSGKATSNILYSNLQRYFSDITVEAVLSLEELETFPLEEINVIISTTAIYRSINKPILVVNPLMQDSDIEKINSFLGKNDIKSYFSEQLTDDIMSLVMQNCIVEDYTKLQTCLLEYFAQMQQKERAGLTLSDMISPDNVRLDVSADTWEDAVRLAGEVLYQNGYIQRRYIEKMIAKVQEVGPYIVVLPGIALPHAGAEDGAINTGMSFVTLKKPIAFGREGYDPVKLVIGLSAVEDMTHIDPLMKLMDFFEDENRTKALLECKEKARFVEMLCEIQDAAD